MKTKKPNVNIYFSDEEPSPEEDRKLLAKIFCILAGAPIANKRK